MLEHIGDTRGRLFRDLSTPGGAQRHTFLERNRASLSRPRFWGLPCQADAESTMLMRLSRSRDLFFILPPHFGSNGAPSAFRVSLVAMVVDEYVRYALLYLACL